METRLQLISSHPSTPSPPPTGRLTCCTDAPPYHPAPAGPPTPLRTLCSSPQCNLPPGSGVGPAPPHAPAHAAWRHKRLLLPAGTRHPCGPNYPRGEHIHPPPQGQPPPRTPPTSQPRCTARPSLPGARGLRVEPGLEVGGVSRGSLGTTSSWILSLPPSEGAGSILGAGNRCQAVLVLQAPALGVGGDPFLPLWASTSPSVRVMLREPQGAGLTAPCSLAGADLARLSRPQATGWWCSLTPPAPPPARLLQPDSLYPASSPPPPILPLFFFSPPTGPSPVSTSPWLPSHCLASQSTPVAPTTLFNVTTTLLAHADSVLTQPLLVLKTCASSI